jgi:hypothetical protein
MTGRTGAGRGSDAPPCCPPTGATSALPLVSRQSSICFSRLAGSSPNASLVPFTPSRRSGTLPIPSWVQRRIWIVAGAPQLPEHGPVVIPVNRPVAGAKRRSVGVRFAVALWVCPLQR